MPAEPEDTERSRPADGPDAEGQDLMGAIVQSPRAVYLYWDLEGPRSREVSRELGPGCQWVVRVLDLSRDTSRNVKVDPQVGRLYVNVHPGHAYGFELAARAAEKWRTVCRTERVQAPPLPAEHKRPGPLERLKPPTARRVPGLCYESTLPFLATSPGAPPDGGGGNDD